jgi:hypothetical protein
MLTRSTLPGILAVAAIGCSNQTAQSPDSTEQTSVVVQNIVVTEQPPAEREATARRALPEEIAGLTPGPDKRTLHLPHPIVSTATLAQRTSRAVSPAATREDPTSTTASALTPGWSCTIPFDDYTGAALEDPAACYTFMETTNPIFNQDGYPGGYWNDCLNGSQNPWVLFAEETGYGHPTYGHFHAAPDNMTGFCYDFSHPTSQCPDGKFGYLQNGACVGVPDSQIDYVDRTLAQHEPDQYIKYSLPDNIDINWRPSFVKVLAGSLNVDVVFLDWNGTWWVYSNLYPNTNWTLNSTGTLGQSAWLAAHVSGSCNPACSGGAICVSGACTEQTINVDNVGLTASY